MFLSSFKRKLNQAIFIAFLVAGFGLSQSTHADSIVRGPITRNTRWTLENSPYLIPSDGEVNLVNVAKGATLTIDPGVTVRFAPRTGLYVEGRIIATGIEAYPVTFTSNYDAPEALNTAYAGDWYGIFIRGEGSALTHSILRYAGLPEFLGYKSGASLILNGNYHRLNHVSVERGAGDGVFFQYGYHVRMTNSVIREHRGHGILMNHSQADDMSENAIYENGKDGLFMKNLADGLFHNNQIYNNAGHGIEINALTAPDIHDNRIESNAKSGIAIVTGYPRIHSNVIDNNDVGISILHNWPQIIQNNDLFDNRSYDFKVESFDAHYSQVNAQKNWWGSAYGPYDSKVSGAIDTSNWLSDPATPFVKKSSHLSSRIRTQAQKLQTQNFWAYNRWIVITRR